MTKEPRRKILGAARTQWETTLEEPGVAVQTQAGEIEPGREAGGGGDKGFDAETGDGGYGGDAALSGHDEAAAQPDRPVDDEIQGDPRTHAGENYPDDPKVVDENEDDGPDLNGEAFDDLDDESDLDDLDDDDDDDDGDEDDDEDEDEEDDEDEE